jgi:hypothetical protein
MPMKNPPHPGGFVLRKCIEPLARIDAGFIMAICLSLSLAAYSQTNFPAPTPPQKGASGDDPRQRNV